LKHNPFKQVGITADGKQVIGGGIYRFKETTGVPLAYLIERLTDGGFIVSWYALIDEALDSGISVQKLMSDLRMAILDVFGKEYLDEVWNAILMKTENNIYKDIVN
jgi:hypothetical protein